MFETEKNELSTEPCIPFLKEQYGSNGIAL